MEKFVNNFFSWLLSSNLIFNYNLNLSIFFLYLFDFYSVVIFTAWHVNAPFFFGITCYGQNINTKKKKNCEGYIIQQKINNQPNLNSMIQKYQRMALCVCDKTEILFVLWFCEPTKKKISWFKYILVGLPQGRILCTTLFIFNEIRFCWKICIPISIK